MRAVCDPARLARWPVRLQLAIDSITCIIGVKAELEFAALGQISHPGSKEHNSAPPYIRPPQPDRPLLGYRGVFSFAITAASWPDVRTRHAHICPSISSRCSLIYALISSRVLSGRSTAAIAATGGKAEWLRTTCGSGMNLPESQPRGRG